MNNNFKWVIEDIDAGMMIMVMKLYKNGNNALVDVFYVDSLIDVSFDEITVETANIDDLTKLLNFGLVRFKNISNENDILDIPFRKLYEIYKRANILGNDSEADLVSFSDVDAFAIINGKPIKDYYIYTTVIKPLNEELIDVMRVAYEYGDYGMQEQFDALTKITSINNKRVSLDSVNRGMK